MGLLDAPANGNYSYHAIIAAYGIAQLFGIRWVMVALGADRNAMPRDDIAKAETAKKLSPRVIAYLKRQSAAHYNGLENLSFFVAAILALNQVKTPVDEINRFALRYLGLRLAYTVYYIVNSNELLALFRTVLWWCVDWPARA